MSAPKRLLTRAFALVMHGCVVQIVVVFGFVYFFPLRLCAGVVHMKRRAPTERMLADTCHTVGNRYARKRLAPVERTPADTRHAGGNRYARKRRAPAERRVADADHPETGEPRPAEVETQSDAPRYFPL